jgi:hypothetical protein
MPQRYALLGLGSAVLDLQMIKCPKCGFEFPDKKIASEAAAVLGRRGRGAAKRRSPEEMSRIGKLGGWPKGKKRGPKKK